MQPMISACRVGIQEPQHFTFPGQRSEGMERAMEGEKEKMEEEDGKGGRKNHIQEEIGRAC